MSISVRVAGGEEITLDEDVARQIKLVEELMDDADGEALPIDRVSKWSFEKAQEYVALVKANGKPEIEGPLYSDDLTVLLGAEWMGFLNMEKEQIFELALAAEYLKMEDMHTLVCTKVASLLYGKDVEQVRGVFGIADHGIDADLQQEIDESIKHGVEYC